MYSDYLNICGIPSKVISYGRRFGLKNTDQDDPEAIILVIPGNPGSPDFYARFLQTLYERTKYPVVAVGHAGHSIKKSLNLPALNENEKLYGLQGQILHKIAFIENHLPKNVRIYIIGHSIGAYIALEMLKEKSIQSRAGGAYLLFPTIEHMATTPNGIKYRTSSNFAWLLVLLCWIVIFLPEILQNFIFGVYKFFAMKSSLLNVEDRVFIDLAHPEIVKRIFFMADQEMVEVKDRNTGVLVKNKRLIKLYYGASDGWTPKSYVYGLKAEIPEIDAQICDRGFTHEFVLYNSVEVGNLVSDWIGS